MYAQKVHKVVGEAAALEFAQTLAKGRRVFVSILGNNVFAVAIGFPPRAGTRVTTVFPQ